MQMQQRQSSEVEERLSLLNQDAVELGVAVET